jgi:hypothetical protein
MMKLHSCLVNFAAAIFGSAKEKHGKSRFSADLGGVFTILNDTSSKESYFQAHLFAFFHDDLGTSSSAETWSFLSNITDAGCSISFSLPMPHMIDFGVDPSLSMKKRRISLRLELHASFVFFLGGNSVATFAFDKSLSLIAIVAEHSSRFPGAQFSLETD